MFLNAIPFVRLPKIAPVITSLAVAVAVATLPSKAQANPRYAALVYDVKGGKTLFSRNADSYRYPASLTKMMTLYMVFDAMERGKMTANTRMRVSKRAASMPPSKLYLKAGSSIKARDAILALVTKSANDVAVVVAEHLGGTESGFARKMTQKARQLGMSRTTFRNASGLPNSGQRTTARDMMKLGLALRKNHARHFRVFATKSFKYGKTTYRNHNRLLGRYGGVNGIKTGYIRASGFNLVTNVERDRRHVVAVVMGGKTGRSRDAHMADLLSRYVKKASRRKSKINSIGKKPLVVAGVSSAAVFDTPPIPTANPNRVAIQPVQVASAATTAPQVLPFPTANPKVVAEHIITDNKIEQGSTPVNPNPAPVVPAATQQAVVDHPGWKIQLAATPTLEAAEKMLDKAAQRGAAVLKNRKPFTERIERSGAVMYRVRFAGFVDKTQARAACKHMKKKSFDCLAVPN